MISFSWSHVIKELTLLGIVLFAFTVFGGVDTTTSDTFEVSCEIVSVFTATEILLTPFESLIGFWDLSSVLKGF